MFASFWSGYHNLELFLLFYQKDFLFRLKQIHKRLQNAYENVFQSYRQINVSREVIRGRGAGQTAPVITV